MEVDPHRPSFLGHEHLGPAVAERRFSVELHRRALSLSRNHLWKRRFDLAVSPRWDADFYHATFLAYFSGARWRMGYSERAAGRFSGAYQGLDQLLTDVIEGDSGAHEVERNLHVVDVLGGSVESNALEVWTDEADESFAEQILKINSISSGELLIAMCLGAGEASRMWPVAAFAELAAWLTEAKSARIVLLSSPDEVGLSVDFQQRYGKKAIDLVGKTTLRQAAAVLKRWACQKQ